MPRVAKPRWKGTHRRWVACIGDVDGRGKRREVYAPPEIGERDELRAWEWLQAEKARRPWLDHAGDVNKMVPTPRVRIPRPDRPRSGGTMSDTPCPVCTRPAPFTRHLGDRFGITGYICGACCQRFTRRLKAEAAGRTLRSLGPRLLRSQERAARPPKPERPPKAPKPPKPLRAPNPSRSEPTPLERAEIAARIRDVRELAEAEGRCPKPSKDEAEIRQSQWADLAAAERRRAVESRRSTSRPCGSLQPIG